MMNKRDYLKKIFIVIMAITVLAATWNGMTVQSASIIESTGEIKYYITDSPVIYDFKSLSFSGDKLVVGGYLVVPVTDFYNFFGCYDISWNSDNKSATITDNDNTYTIYSGTTYLIKNDVMITSPAPCFIYQNRLYASLKVMADSLGIKTLYDENTDAILMTKTSFYFNTSYTFEDLYWLSRIVYSEAGQESYEGMVAVANVVLNRVKHKDFPDTIYGVIFDKVGGVQFTPVSAGTVYNEPSEAAINAARDALNGYNNISWALFFFNPKIARSTWIADTCNFFKTIGNHDFYY